MRYTVPKVINIQNFTYRYLRGSLEIGRQNGLIKTIQVSDVSKAVTDGSKIKPEVATEIGEALQETGANMLYNEVRVINLEGGDVFRTNVVQNGNFFDVIFEMNEYQLADMTGKEIDDMFLKSQMTIADTMKEAVIHEKYHAMWLDGLNYPQVNRLTEELGEIHIEGVSKLASINGDELISEVGVLYERGELEQVPDAARQLFEKYIINHDIY